MEAEILFFCSAVGIPVQEWDLRSPPLVCILAWDGLFLLWKTIIYQGYCQNGCNWSCAKFLVVLSTDGNEGERTHPDTVSMDQLGSIMMVQWHCLKLPQNNYLCVLRKQSGSSFLHLVRVRSFCVELRAEQDQTIPLSQLVGSAIIWFLWLMLHSASLILNFQDSSIDGFLSVSFHWVKSDHVKHGSPDSIFYSQEASGLQHPGELLGENLFITLLVGRFRFSLECKLSGL